MKNLEKLKQEQQELKERLMRLIDLMNSEEYFTVAEGEKQLLASQRTGMEMYLNALTTRIYGNVNEFSGMSSSMLPLMIGMMSFPPFQSKSTAVEEIKEQIEKSEK